MSTYDGGQVQTSPRPRRHPHFAALPASGLCPVRPSKPSGSPVVPVEVGRTAWLRPEVQREPWGPSHLSLYQDTLCSTPKTVPAGQQPSRPYSLGIRGVPEAQDGKVHLAEGGRWQILPEYELPEVLQPEEAKLEALFWATGVLGGRGSCIQDPPCSSRSLLLKQDRFFFFFFNSITMAKKLGKGRKS